MCEVASGTRLVHYFAGSGDTQILLASTAGYGFTAKASDMVSRIKAGKAFMTLDEGDEPIAPSVLSETASAIACLSEKGRLLVFGLDEMKTLSGGGRGVILMELEKNEKLLATHAISQKGVIVFGTGRGGKEQTLELTAGHLKDHIGKRARKGKALESRIKAAALAPRK